MLLADTEFSMCFFDFPKSFLLTHTSQYKLTYWAFVKPLANVTFIDLWFISPTRHTLVPTQNGQYKK